MSSTQRKYPRTPHLPWSPGATADDTRVMDCSHFEGKAIVVTEKMDGENTTLYRDGLHARSLDSRHHPSRDWVKAWHGGIAHSIPEGWRICGENVYARHSIGYDQLESYFYLFSIWDEQNQCLSWPDTLEWAALLECPCPAVLYEGTWDAPLIRQLKINPDTTEGYVVRLAEVFSFGDFSSAMGKWVRPHHVQTDQHWMHAPIVPNKLRQHG